MNKKILCISVALTSLLFLNGCTPGEKLTPSSESPEINKAVNALPPVPDAPGPMSNDAEVPSPPSPPPAPPSEKFPISEDPSERPAVIPTLPKDTIYYKTASGRKFYKTRDGIHHYLR